MYTTHFGFADLPFNQLSDPQLIFSSNGFHNLHTELARSLQGGTPGVLLTGDSGVGKTKILSHTYHLLREKRPAFYLSESALLIEDFIQYAADVMKIDLLAKRDIFDSFQDGLIRLGVGASKPVLLIDNAHNLGKDVLENIVGLFQLKLSHTPLAHLVLAALPTIESLLQTYELDELAETLTWLPPMQSLHEQEIEPYINFALRAVNYDGHPLFTEDALRTLAEQTNGVPALVNDIAHAALFVSFKSGQKLITAEVIKTAVAEIPAVPVAGNSKLQWKKNHPSSNEETLKMMTAASKSAPRWFKKDCPWPVTVVSFSLMAVLVLVAELSFPDNIAEARQRSTNSLLMKQVEILREQILEVHIERRRLEIELDTYIHGDDQQLDKLLFVKNPNRLENEMDFSPTKVSLVAGEGPRYESPPITSKRAAASEVEVVVALNAATFKEIPLGGGEHFSEYKSRGVPVGLFIDSIKPVDAFVGTVLIPEPTKKPIQRHDVYVVQKGDTIWSISQHFDITVEELVAVNAIADRGYVFPGQELISNNIGHHDNRSHDIYSTHKPIVATDAVMEWYVVRPGDTLSAIGRDFAASVDDLIQWNGLHHGGDIQSGQRLRLVPLVN